MYEEFPQMRSSTREGPSGDYDCPSVSPNINPSRMLYVCTLNAGHEGTHLAGLGDGFVGAEWDDDRSTDREQER